MTAQSEASVADAVGEERSETEDRPSATAQRKAPRRLRVIANPIASAPDLDHAFAFRADASGGSRSPLRMSDDVLEQYIRQLVESHRAPRVSVAWSAASNDPRNGVASGTSGSNDVEPMSAGITFFRRVIELENKYARPGMVFDNTLQATGALIDDGWCAFFKESGFVIDVDVDGPRDVHDGYRLESGLEPSFDVVMRGLSLLAKHGVEHGVRCMIHRTNGDHPLLVYRFLRDEIGAQWIRFVPVVERVLGSVASRRSVMPDQFGKFMCAVFDEWVRNDVGHVYVDTFEAAVRNWLGGPSSGSCLFDATCGHGLALEPSGDLHSCDHFATPAGRIGNIQSEHLSSLASSEAQRAFRHHKLDSLPQKCRTCAVRFACHGECPKRRFTKTADGEPGLNYLCAGYMSFFRHIDRPMRSMAELIRRGLPAALIMEMLAAEEGGDEPLAKAEARA